MVNLHGRMAKGGHELPKVLSGPAMPNPSTPCERATPFKGCPTCRVPACGCLPPFGHPTPYAYVILGYRQFHESVDQRRRSEARQNQGPVEMTFLELTPRL
jgi:hypothetical protein